MPYGFYVKNDLGTFVIDETYKNLCIVNNGQFTLSSTRQTITCGPGTLRRPIIALRVSGGSAGIRNVTTSLGVTTAVIVGSVGSVVTWYHFDVPPNTGTGTFGMQVFTDTGDVIFDSSFKYARVFEGYESIPETSWRGTKSYGFLPAVAFISPAAWQRAESRQGGCPGSQEQHRYTYEDMTCATSGNTVTIGSFVWQQDTNWSPCVATSQRAHKGRASYAILDISGYF